MIRRSTVIWSALAIGVGVGLFFVKHQVQALEDRLVSVNREIAANRETIHVLTAEWSHLTRPDRLEDLGRRLLALEPVTREQTIDISELPERLSVIDGPGASDTAARSPVGGNKAWIGTVLADLEKSR